MSDDRKKDRTDVGVLPFATTSARQQASVLLSSHACSSVLAEGKASLYGILGRVQELPEASRILKKSS